MVSQMACDVSLCRFKILHHKRFIILLHRKRRQYIHKAAFCRTSASAARALGLQRGQLKSSCRNVSFRICLHAKKIVNYLLTTCSEACARTSLASIICHAHVEAGKGPLTESVKRSRFRQVPRVCHPTIKTFSKPNLLCSMRSITWFIRTFNYATRAAYPHPLPDAARGVSVSQLLMRQPQR